ncbi:Ger(x)C family spore germination protein [Psychrobacillus sp. NEAU-3TGS]|uniref:Ger(x)C family spore germination protein n=1 Tax=Psychrobacillus sp. NEAU-3TGS TaxID=2995412 RepID=UPI0024990F6B|nr:Ger(x)C family spore germination protein [Psychrobacillus sp. NEAU-3TGS]MDI2588909.1 Ger(x)C family spore germination protein [Psychrobacillus sp. NEAU-3TGS]
MKKGIFILLILSIFLTGCWNRRELNELGITLAIGIDKSDDEYLVSAQVVVPSEVSMKGGTGATPVTLIKGRGETVYEAIRKMTKGMSRKIYPGHLRMLIISESLAKEGIGDPLDLISRDWELRSDFYVAVARDATAEQILNVQTPLETIPANKMFSTLKVSEENWAATVGVTLDQLITDLRSDGKEAVLTGILVTGNSEIGSSKQNVETITPATSIKLDDLAVFKEDKLVGWLTEDESRGYNGIVNQVKNTVGTVSCPEGGKADIEVLHFKTKVKGIVKNGSPEVDLQVNIEANVGAVECRIDLTKPESIKILEKAYEKAVEETINHSIISVQEKYETDIFGFGNAIHRSNPKEWKTMKKQWNQHFTDLAANVKVDVKILKTGTVNNSVVVKRKD